MTQLLELPKHLLKKMDLGEERPLTVRDFLGDLPERSEKELGYGLLKQIVERKNLESSLGTALRKLKMKIFTKESVMAYKKAVAIEMNRDSFHYNLGDYLKDHVQLSTVFSLPVVLSLVALLYQSFKMSEVFVGWLIGLSPVIGLIIGYFLNRRVAIKKYFHLISNTTVMVLKGNKKDVEERLWDAGIKGTGFIWKKIPLKTYQLPVPELALANALRIKECVPGAKFYVHEIASVDITEPFLSVQCGEEEYYFAVWDEPKFTSFKEEQQL